jgi:DNA-directed RNA polymerase, omega subunit
MLYPQMSVLIEKTGSRYLLVNLVARRAREISENAEEQGIQIRKKPVSSAIDEIYTGRLKIRDNDKM